MAENYFDTEEYKSFVPKPGGVEIDANGPTARLIQRLYEAYKEYETHLEDQYPARTRAQLMEAASQQLYVKLKAGLEKANQTARCRLIKANGQQCGSPRMSDGELCYAHARIAESRAKSLDLPSLEDANGVQLALMKVAKWLIDGEVDAKKAMAISYLVQTAASNVGKVNFDQGGAKSGDHPMTRNSGAPWGRRGDRIIG